MICIQWPYTVCRGRRRRRRKIHLDTAPTSRVQNGTARDDYTLSYSFAAKYTHPTVKTVHIKVYCTGLQKYKYGGVQYSTGL